MGGRCRNLRVVGPWEIVGKVKVTVIAAGAHPTIHFLLDWNNPFFIRLKMFSLS